MQELPSPTTRKPKRYLIIQKGRLGIYWRLQTNKPPKIGDKIACGGQPYNNKKECIKMALSVIKGTAEIIQEDAGRLIYEVKNFK